MSSAEQLYLLADHIKLSLLERQRAQSLGLDNDSQDGHLSRSFEQFKTGLASLEIEKAKLQNGGDERYCDNDELKQLANCPNYETYLTGQDQL